VHIFVLAYKQRNKKVVSSDEDTSSESSNDSSDDSNDDPKESGSKKKKRSKYDKRSAEEIERMRVDFPNLSHHSDETFKTLSWTELIRLDRKLENSAKSSKKLTEKLAKNLEKIKKFPSKIQAGEDNRADKLHEARFLGGHTCRHTDVWLQARRSIGLSGLDPVSRYDSECLGMSSHLNSHIWAELHYPGSKEVSIKMLSPQALKAARGSSDKEAASIKKDFEEISEIAVAVNTLTHAVHCIHPWNFAFATLDFFLTTVQYGEKESAGKTEKISFLCDFIDDVIRHNAEAWDDSKPFLTATELSSKWITEIMMRFPRAGPSKTNYRPEKTPQRKTDSNTPPPPPNKFNKQQGPFIPYGFCRRFNFNHCPNQKDKTCPAPWDQTKQLKHECAHWNPNTNKYCLQNHSFVDHK
jgi:hypothetical protein